MAASEYWDWMKRVCKLIYECTSDGGSIYFMQREKNAQFVLETLLSTGWVFQNLIIWKKKTSAVPCEARFGKHYQIIAFATKGKTPRVFNKLRIDPPLLVTDKYERPNGMFVTDVWDDIRELTSGYFAGTGTTLVVAKQLQRNSLGIEIDPTNVSFIENRLYNERLSDNMLQNRSDYFFTENLDKIWPLSASDKIDKKI